MADQAQFDLAGGASGSNRMDVTLCEAAVNQINHRYDLEKNLPEHTSLPPDEVARLLASMREQYRLAEEQWEECARGDTAEYIRFIQSINKLALYSDNLGRNTLQYLTRQIQSVALLADTPEQIRLIAMDLSMTLLLLGNGIEHYSRLSDGFHEQVRILSERMQAVLEQRPQDSQRLTELIRLHCQMQQRVVGGQLLKELLINLRQLKQDMDAFFGNLSHREALAGMKRQLAQLKGGLRFLPLAQAEQLLLAIQENVSFLDQSKTVPLPVESLTLTSAVSVLENFLANVLEGRPGEVAELLTMVDDLVKLRQVATVIVAESAVRPVGEVARQQAEDQELLEVFLEEAQEALVMVRENLVLSMVNLEAQEHLAAIRRGFHTLKGSGRMVGLTDLGEVAWVIERALNKWLRDNKPATPELLQFIKLAMQRFTGWVESVVRGQRTEVRGQKTEDRGQIGGVQFEAEDLVAMALQVECGLVVESLLINDAVDITAQPMADEAEVVEASVSVELPASAEPEQVVIGDITLNPVLFKIASEEALQNALALRRHLVEMCASQPPAVQYDFMRAAHTLAGVCRNMSMDVVANLSNSLENWLHVRMGQAFTLSALQAQLLDQTVNALQDMVQDICQRKLPSSQESLVEQLRADKDKLGVNTQATSISETLQRVQQAATETKKSEVQLRAAKQQVHDDVDEQLLPIFLAEADELIPKIGNGLRSWCENPLDANHSDLLKRWLHTLKGSARMAGAMCIGEIAHDMEERVIGAKKMHEQVGYWDGLDDDFDRIGNLLEEFRGGEYKQAATAQPEYGRQVEDRVVMERKAERHMLEIGAERLLQASMLRVRSDVVDRLVNEAGEISVVRSRMETEMSAVKEGLLELNSSVMRLREQLRELERQAESQIRERVTPLQNQAEHFDPLEFDRFTRLQELTSAMNESVHDVQSVQQSLLKNIDETVTVMSKQARLTRELQQGLMNVRMVPFASLSERLYRIVRQTAKELDKRANLELVGAGLELDRSVLEKMAAPFEHLLRNAIAHGLENAPIREQNGKNPIGEIRLHLRQESNEVVFEFSDDGAGLNFAMLREKAMEIGLLTLNEPVSDEQLAQLIFTSGISTAREVTEVAGRGIGMDVVRSEIAALGGRIDVSSKSGLGTRFIIHLPLTLAITHVLMVRSGDEIYAIPSTMVEQVRQVKQLEMAAIYRERQTVWQGKTYLFHYLANLLGDAHVPETQPRNSLLLLRSGEQCLALHVNALLGNHEVVVKNIGPQLARLPSVTGATVLGNGAVVLILNPAQLSQRIVVAAPSALALLEKPRTQPLIMVVDDSLTVRKITTRLLARAGYQVVTAKDGVDALEQLIEISPDVMLLDIEMPRMDGFELARHLRLSPKTQNLPIIIITSRTAEKHRNYAGELGVAAYLGKPYQEEELLRHIAQIMVSTS